jgi:hypothetical protein
MFWRKSRRSRNDPDELNRSLLQVFAKSRPDTVFTLDDLTDRVKTGRKDIVAFLLSNLASSNVIEQVVRVYSPRGGGIREYSSLSEVPDILFDPFKLEEITVDPTMIKVFFRAGSKDLIQGESKPTRSDRSRAIA